MIIIFMVCEELDLYLLLSVCLHEIVCSQAPEEIASDLKDVISPTTMVLVLLMNLVQLSVLPYSQSLNRELQLSDMTS